MLQYKSTSGPRVRGMDPKDREGLRRLAKASLSKAIDDAGGGDLQPAHSAIRWLAGHATEGLTFRACCDLIGIAPHTVLRSLRRRYEPIRLRLERYLEVDLMPVAKPRNHLGA